jgi:C4-type Zn-finger protein
MADLPPYNPDARCPKCHHDKASTRWRLQKVGYISTHNEWQWLSRCCERCGYIWDEACVDGGTDG